MSNYKRFIMYLFQYENGSKQANCGFAKVECRQNKGRMQLHINEDICREDVCHVYFFVKGEQELPCILLGELAAETVDAGFVFDCKRTGGSIYGFEEIRGLVIPLADGKMIASQWDDEEYDWGQLKYEPTSNEIPSEEAGKLEKMVHTANGKADSEESLKHEDMITEAQEQQERFTGNQVRTEKIVSAGHLSENKSQGVTGQRNSVAPSSGFAENNIQATEQDISMNKKTECGEKQQNESDLKMQSMSGAATRRMTYPLLDDDAPTDRQRGRRNSGSAGQTNCQKKAFENAGAYKEKETTDGGMTYEPPTKKKEQAENTTNISETVQHFKSIYPRVYPFAGDKSVWGMQIQLKDLKYLPQEYQMLGNNSFLLHGFFTYGTLLLGYMEDTQQWFLGVPGIYQNQERVMAALFGFPEFRTRQECVQKTGEFGYWYRFLM